MNKTVLVTGGNRGIGHAIVRGLAENSNLKVLMGCRDLKSEQFANEDVPDNVVPVQIDLVDPEKIAQQVEKIIKEHGQIDVLINNSGVYRDGSGLDVTQQDLEESLQINAVGAHQLMQLLTPSMIKNGYGRIVNMSSGYGSFAEGLGGSYAYSVSKALLNAMTKSFVKNLPENVKVNSMCPGWVKTRMGGNAAPRTPEQGAETAIWLATLPNNGPTGQFFRDKKQIEW